MRWAADKVTAGDSDLLQKVGRSALQDVEHTARDAGEPVPEFVDTADVLSDDCKFKLPDEITTDEDGDQPHRPRRGLAASPASPN